MRWLIGVVVCLGFGCKPETETILIETFYEYECWIIPAADAEVRDEDGGVE